MGKSIAIEERTQCGCPVVMMMDANRMISIQSKKLNGRRRDYSHDLNDYYEANPLIAQEIFERRESIHSPMSQELRSFIEDMWLMAEEMDPWYITDPIEEEDFEN